MPELPPGSHDDSSDGRALNEATQSEAPGRKNGRRKHGLGSWLLLLLGGTLGYLGGLYYLSKVPRQYTATTTLQVTPRTEDGRSGGRTDASDLRDLNTMVERIRRRDLLELLARRQDVRDLEGLRPQTEIDWRPEWLGRFARSPSPPTPPSSAPPPEVLQGMIYRWLTVSIRPGTWLIDISITHPEPDCVPNLANAVAREFLSELSQQRARAGAEEHTRYSGVSGRSSIIDKKIAERVHLQRDPFADSQELARLDAEIKKLEEEFLAEVAGSLAASGRDSYSTAIREELADLALDSDGRLRVAREALTARIAELKWELETGDTGFGSFDVEINSFASTPGGPSSPDRTQALTLGTLGGLLLALLLAGLRRN